MMQNAYISVKAFLNDCFRSVFRGENIFRLVFSLCAIFIFLLGSACNPIRSREFKKEQRVSPKSHKGNGAAVKQISDRLGYKPRKQPILAKTKGLSPQTPAMAEENTQKNEGIVDQYETEFRFILMSGIGLMFDELNNEKIERTVFEYDPRHRLLGSTGHVFLLTEIGIGNLRDRVSIGLQFFGELGVTSPRLDYEMVRGKKLDFSDVHAIGMASYGVCLASYIPFEFEMMGVKLFSVPNMYMEAVMGLGASNYFMNGVNFARAKIFPYYVGLRYYLTRELFWRALLGGRISYFYSIRDVQTKSFIRRLWLQEDSAISFSVGYQL